MVCYDYTSINTILITTDYYHHYIAISLFCLHCTDTFGWATGSGHQAHKNSCFKTICEVINASVSGCTIARNTLWTTLPVYFKRIVVCPMRMLRIRMTKLKTANQSGKWPTQVYVENG